MKTFKIIREDEVRVVTFANDDGKCFPTFKLLKSKVDGLFPDLPANAALVYRDHEGDVVTIVDDDSVRAVLIDAANKQATNIRITVLTPEPGSRQPGHKRARTGCHQAAAQKTPCGQKGAVHRKCGGFGGRGFGGCIGLPSLSTIGAVLGLRMIGVSWCALIGFGLLRHLYKSELARTTRSVWWPSDAKGEDAWVHLQAAPFRVRTPFFTLVGSEFGPFDAFNHLKARRVTRQHAHSKDTTNPSRTTPTPTSTSTKETHDAEPSPPQGYKVVPPPQETNEEVTSDSALADDITTIPYAVDVDSETDTVLVNTADADREDVEAKVNLIKNMGFDLDDAVIASLVKEMNGRVDLIVSALLKNRA